MLKHTLLGESKRIVLYALCIFIILGSSYLLIATVFQFNTNKIQKSAIINSEVSLVDVEKTIISNKVSLLITDLLYISDSLKLSSERDENYSDLEKQWLAFSDRKKIYYQIRYIDLNGNEVIRINYSQDGAYSVKREDLQNKKDMYFADTILLNENQIYISKLDLNLENNVVEQPIKPMIRLATPVYGTDGKLKGIVILNYLADDMLGQVKKIASTTQGSIFMINSDGYWLYNGEDSNKEWTFMYGERKTESFQYEYPDEWKIIKNNEVGGTIISKGVFNYTNVLASNEFSFENVNNSIVLGDGDWYIVSHISPNSEKGKLFSLNIFRVIAYVLKHSIVTLFLLFCSALVLAILMTINKIKNDKIIYFSEYDTMTGVYNRRAGFEKLNYIYKAAIKNKSKTCVCFIDINGLKEVNDFLGHEAGDELILSIIDGIKKVIRDNDFVVRLGGDEFLIIFEGLDEKEAEIIWQLIYKKYNQINENENRNYIISVSHGIEEFKFNSEECIDLIVNYADEKMYNEKKIIKKELKIIKDCYQKVF